MIDLLRIGFDEGISADEIADGLRRHAGDVASEDVDELAAVLEGYLRAVPDALATALGMSKDPHFGRAVAFATGTILTYIFDEEDLLPEASYGVVGLLDDAYLVHGFVDSLGRMYPSAALGRVRGPGCAHVGGRGGRPSGGRRGLAAADVREHDPGRASPLPVGAECRRCRGDVRAAAQGGGGGGCRREGAGSVASPRRMATTHEFPTDRVHFTWDAGNEPVLTIESGDTVVYETREVSDNQITPDSTAEDIATLDWDRVYPLAGPVLVEGAEPGDTLAIEILAMETRGWGYTMIIPGFGLLPDDFPDPYIRVFDLSNGEFAYLRDDIAIPVEPFFGTMGVCPAGAKEQAIMPPGRFGGNMDTRQLVQGTTLYLPVEVEGALVQLRRRARGPGRRGGVRDRHRGADARRAPLHAPERPADPGAAVPDDRPADAAGGRRRLVRNDRSRPRSLRRGAGRRPRHGRPPRRGVRPLAGGRLRAVQPLRRPEDLGGRRRGAVRRQRPASAGGVHVPGLTGR